MQYPRTVLNMFTAGVDMLKWFWSKAPIVVDNTVVGAFLCFAALLRGHTVNICEEFVKEFIKYLFAMNYGYILRYEPHLD